MMANAVSVPGMVGIKATKITIPPAWALLERKLIGLIDEAAVLCSAKYSSAGGLSYAVHDVDDVYESRSMRGIFYAVGGDDRILDIAIREWNATTRYYDDGVKPPSDVPAHPFYMAQLHNEYWNLSVPFNADWFHMGEGNQSFYDFGVACPTDAEMRLRARRFANMYTGEDPEAPNYDPEYKIIRCPFHGGAGPFLKCRQHTGLIHTNGQVSGHLELVRNWLDRGSMGDFGHRSPMVENPSKTPLITMLYPVVKELEPNWYEDPKRREDILDLFDEVVLNGDEPSNLCATALVTNAYLYTGEEKYKKWVLDYVDVWMDRIRENNGIIPDNVGPTGKVGENRQGQWWGGIHGWNNPNANDRMFLGLIIASECALLLSGDFKYLDLLRSQVKVLMDNSITREDGQLLVPSRHGPNGWADYQPMKVRGGVPHLVHLWHASMNQADRESIASVRAGEMELDWNEVESIGDRGGAGTEYARFQYYDGMNPGWPEQIMRADYDQALHTYEAMLNDSRDVSKIVEDSLWPPNPVIVKGLVQVTMGTPQTLYNGGLLRATVRYFDQDRARPGLPKDVAALVDELGPERTGVQLVNTSAGETRNLIVQAGAFGEHQFTEVRFDEESLDCAESNPSRRARAERTITEKAMPIDSKYLAVQLPPSTSIRLDLGMRRFVNDPSYAFPWHGDKIPVPFQ